MLQRHSADTAGPFSKWKVQKSRIRSAATSVASAEQAIGQIQRGGVQVGVTKGRFSALDMIDAVLRQTGPARVDVSTWTMGVYDADAMWKFTENRDIVRLRFLLDPSMFGRREDLAKSFLAAFGGENIRAIDNHAKFTLIGNDEWNVSISSSMNLNKNARLENYVLIEDREIYRFYENIVDQVFEQCAETYVDKKRTRIEFDGLSFGEASEKNEQSVIDDVW